MTLYSDSNALAVVVVLALKVVQVLPQEMTVASPLGRGGLMFCEGVAGVVRGVLRTLVAVILMVSLQNELGCGGWVVVLALVRRVGLGLLSWSM